MAGFGPQIAPCPPEARAAALEVLYRRVPEALRYRLIVEVLNEATRGEIDLSGLWVAHERTGRIVGALLTQPLAGKAAAVWAPEVKPSWRRPVAGRRATSRGPCRFEGARVPVGPGGARRIRGATSSPRSDERRNAPRHRPALPRTRDRAASARASEKRLPGD